MISTKFLHIHIFAIVLFFFLFHAVSLKISHINLTHTILFTPSFCLCLLQLAVTMEQEHRTKILSNIDKLVKFTNYDVLVKACLDQQLLYKVMVDKIQVSFLFLH